MKIAPHEISQKQLIIDVRSPSEFAKGHIPGAYNIELFSDEERAEVGTLYKKEGREKAILRGLELVGPKMANLACKIREFDHPNPLIHCWRGGMRSSSVAWLARTVDLKPTTLKGGYKAYRNLVLETLETHYDLRILGGKTGSGKTEILTELAKLGEQVLDLEGLAHHKGSIFGDLGQGKQPTPQQFENEIAAKLFYFDPCKPIWVENESAAVGRIFIPKALNDQIRKAPLLQVEIDDDVRKARIVEEYGHFPIIELIERTKKIERRLGGLNCKLAIKALEENQVTRATEILMEYYDKTYEHSRSKRDPNKITHTTLEGDSVLEWAKQIRGNNGY